MGGLVWAVSPWLWAVSCDRLGLMTSEEAETPVTLAAEFKSLSRTISVSPQSVTAARGDESLWIRKSQIDIALETSHDSATIATSID